MTFAVSPAYVKLKLNPKIQSHGKKSFWILRDFATTNQIFILTNLAAELHPIIWMGAGLVYCLQSKPMQQMFPADLWHTKMHLSFCLSANKEQQGYLKCLLVSSVYTAMKQSGKNTCHPKKHVIQIHVVQMLVNTPWLPNPFFAVVCQEVLYCHTI